MLKNITKIKNTKIMTSVRTKMTSVKTLVSNFTKGHQNVTDVMAGDVSNRFSAKFKKLFKNNEILVVSPESIKGEKVGIFKRISDLFDGEVTVIDEDDYVDSLKRRHRW